MGWNITLLICSDFIKGKICGNKLFQGTVPKFIRKGGEVRKPWYNLCSKWDLDRFCRGLTLRLFVLRRALLYITWIAYCVLGLNNAYTVGFARPYNLRFPPLHRCLSQTCNKDANFYFSNFASGSYITCTVPKISTWILFCYIYYTPLFGRNSVACAGLVS
jgi:hypothetical protein